MFQPFSPNDILNIWEQGINLHPVDKALNIVIHAYPDVSFREASEFSIVRRDLCLLEIYEENFGDTFNCFLACPSCKEKLEFDIASGDILTKQNEIKDTHFIDIKVNGLNIKLRLPNSLDLASVALCENAETARNDLIKSCITVAGKGDKAFPQSEITQNILDAVSEYMTGYEHNGDIYIDIKCNVCSHQWHAQFDIFAFVWKEISLRARRLLYEIHMLASIYGWHERDIIGMSALRRRCYLEMAG